MEVDSNLKQIDTNHLSSLRHPCTFCIEHVERERERETKPVKENRVKEKEKRELTSRSIGGGANTNQRKKEYVRRKKRERERTVYVLARFWVCVCWEKREREWSVSPAERRDNLRQLECLLEQTTAVVVVGQPEKWDDSTQTHRAIRVTSHQHTATYAVLLATTPTGMQFQMGQPRPAKQKTTKRLLR